MKKIKKIFLRFALVAIFALFLGFLITGFTPITAQDNFNQTLSIGRIRYILELNPDFDFLKGSLFSSLLINGGIPIDPQKEGRANPFAPY